MTMQAILELKQQVERFSNGKMSIGIEQDDDAIDFFNQNSIEDAIGYRGPEHRVFLTGDSENYFIWEFFFNADYSLTASNTEDQDEIIASFEDFAACCIAAAK